MGTTKKYVELARLEKYGRKRVEPGARRGDAEVPEIIIVSDAVESTNVDLDGKSRRGRRKIFWKRKKKYQAKRVRR